LARIYTRTGDDGTTGLVGGKRVSKDSPWIDACGSLDELNALIGVTRSHVLPDRVDNALQIIQENLFTIGEELATPEGSKRSDRWIREEDVRALENEIDFFEAGLQTLKHFILPGGASAGATLHLVRAVARRAERNCVALSRSATINPAILCYLNRFSDLCFVLARYVNFLQSIPEAHATPGRGRDGTHF
jgi:cob(I)alamin adenosyltransferase